MLRGLSGSDARSGAGAHEAQTSFHEEQHPVGLCCAEEEGRADPWGLQPGKAHLATAPNV